ncbi:hypothetical protein COB64_04000 [Candidatus Wolfebacteria bacterium]|nr:MAG: hypothetical protein COB64_04000 [Candidatus Wolfebacteria bacterium]
MVDSYRNILGRAYKSYNPDTKNFEIKIEDHNGKPMFSEPFANDWSMEKAVLQNKDQLMKDAHQRRLEAKGKDQSISKVIDQDAEKKLKKAVKQSQSKPEVEKQPDKVELRQEELHQVREEQERVSDHDEPEIEV